MQFLTQEGLKRLLSVIKEERDKALFLKLGQRTHLTASLHPQAWMLEVGSIIVISIGDAKRFLKGIKIS
jgi:hypothetical protein